MDATFPHPVTPGVRSPGRTRLATGLVLLAIGAAGCGGDDRPAPGPVIIPQAPPPASCDVRGSHLPRTADAAARWLSSCHGVPDSGYAGLPDRPVR